MTDGRTASLHPHAGAWQGPLLELLHPGLHSAKSLARTARVTAAARQASCPDLTAKRRQAAATPGIPCLHGNRIDRGGGYDWLYGSAAQSASPDNNWQQIAPRQIDLGYPQSGNVNWQPGRVFAAQTALNSVQYSIARTPLAIHTSVSGRKAPFGIPGALESMRLRQATCVKGLLLLATLLCGQLCAAAAVGPAPLVRVCLLGGRRRWGAAAPAGERAAQPEPCTPRPSY